jgi:multiple sugar transport system permease protein
MAVLVYYPAIVTLWRSFHSLRLGPNATERFVGLGQYISQLTPGSDFWDATLITARITVTTLPLEIVLGTLAAVTLNTQFRGRGVIRVLAMLPWMLPPLVNGFMWNWMLNGEFGALNGIAYQLGLIDRYQYWLQEPGNQLLWTSIAQSWTRYAFVMLVLLAGLQSIPTSIYEAAKLDGAGPLTSFLRITLPHLVPSLTIALAIEFIATVQIFDLVWSITAGGGAGGQINPFTKVLMIENYEVVFRNLQVGLGSAISYLILLVSMGGAVLFVRYLYRRVSL